MRSTWAIPAILLAGSLWFLPPEPLSISFPEPIDALSITLPSEEATVSVRGKTAGGWTAWQELSVENEPDPRLRESNLVLFPESVERVHIRGDAARSDVHPVRISRAPVRYLVAAVSPAPRPRILSRREWDADESLLLQSEAPPQTPSGSTEEKDANGDGDTEPRELTQRERDCEDAQRSHPQEFATTKTVSQTSNGERLRWPRQYAQDVRLLAIHHTAIANDGDNRSGAERMRALYQYHSINRGWGDIGYHYVIDDEGQIYEGRSGGERVVGGHAWCNNVGTIGVALMGNFEKEKPTQDQMKGLQWLLDLLADQYGIDPGAQTTFHGKTTPTIVGHRDLVPTECPGYYVRETMGQVRSHVVAGNLDAPVRFPVIAKRKERAQSRAAAARAKSTSRRIATLTRKIRRADRLSGRTGRAYARPTTGSARTSRYLRPTTLSPSAFSRIRIRLTQIDRSLRSCEDSDLTALAERYRGGLTCSMIDGAPAIINTLSLEDYLRGLAEEPDSEHSEKQRAFAIAARTYAAYYMDPAHRKFPGKPFDGSDDPAVFQAYGGRAFEERNPAWVRAVEATEGRVMKKNGQIIKAAYFSTDDGRTRSPAEAGWSDFPFAEIFVSKPDPWCSGMQNRGHGVGMSGCGAGGQAREGKTAEEILAYYYPGTTLRVVSDE